MIKKLSLCLLSFGASFSASCGNAFLFGNDVSRAENWQPQIDLPTSVVVCRQKQCAPAKLSMSKEYIYNSLLHLLDNNSQNKALLCRADASSHLCVENYITVPITVGVTPANMYIDDVKITDVSASIGNKSLDLILNYNVSYNGQTPVCKPSKTLIYVKNAHNIVMEDAGYSCKMTTIGHTTIKTLFAIDYIDLDYGYIGGYYSIGLSGPAFGGDSGYMMMRLPQDAYPLSPELILKEEVEEIKEEPKKEAQEEPKAEPIAVTTQTVIDANGMPVEVKLDADGKPIPMSVQTPQAQLDANGNPISMQVPMPQVQFDANGNPLPMPAPMPQAQYGANGYPMPNLGYDANGNPVKVPLKMELDINGNLVFLPEGQNLTEEQPKEQLKEKSKKVSKKKAKKKAKQKPKKSSDIEASVTTNIVPMEKRKPLPKPEPKVEEPKPVENVYEGVKVYPIPMKKKTATDKVVVNEGSNLRDDIAQME